MPDRGTDLIGGISEILDLYVRSKEKERDLYKAAEKKEQQLVQVTYPDGSVRMEPRVSGMQIKPATPEEDPTAPTTESIGGVDMQFNPDKNKYEPIEISESAFMQQVQEKIGKLTPAQKRLVKRHEDILKEKKLLTEPRWDVKGQEFIDPTEDGTQWTDKRQTKLESIEKAMRKNMPGYLEILEGKEFNPETGEFESGQEENVGKEVKEEDDYRFYNDPVVSEEAKVDSTQDWINQFKRQ